MNDKNCLDFDEKCIIKNTKIYKKFILDVDTEC